MADAQSSSAMKNLVIVIIKLAILGLVLAFAWYLFVEVLCPSGLRCTHLRTR